jgi:hypothetical protein
VTAKVSKVRKVFLRIEKNKSTKKVKQKKQRSKKNKRQDERGKMDTNLNSLNSTTSSARIDLDGPVQGHNAGNVPENLPSAQQNEPAGSDDGSAKSIDEIFNEAYKQSASKESKDAGENEITKKVGQPKLENAIEPKNENDTAFSKTQEKVNRKEYEVEKYWNEKQKEFFNSLDKKTQENFLDFFKSSQGIYERITNDYKNDFNSMQKALEPVLSDLAKATPEASLTEVKEYVSFLVSLKNELASDPALMLAKIVEGYGLTQDDVDAAFNRIGMVTTAEKQVAPLQTEIGRLQEKLNRYEEENRYNEIGVAYQKLSTEKNLDGSVKYKYLDKIPDEDVVKILEVGGLENFEQGYNAYIWGVPKVREEILKEQQAQASTQPQNLAAQKPQKQVVQKPNLPTTFPRTSAMSITPSTESGENKSIDDLFRDALRQVGY